MALDNSLTALIISRVVAADNGENENGDTQLHWQNGVSSALPCLGLYHNGGFNHLPRSFWGRLILRSTIGGMTLANRLRQSWRFRSEWSAVGFLYFCIRRIGRCSRRWRGILWPCRR